MNITNDPERKMSLDVHSLSSDTALPDLSNYVGDTAFVNESFLITSSLPNITAFHNNKSMSSISESDDNMLQNSISGSEDEELQCLMDTIPVCNNKCSDEMTEGNSVSQLMIYPRANTPQPEGENSLPTILISDSGTLQPLSRCGSFISVKSIEPDNVQEIGIFNPRSRCGSFVSVKSITKASSDISKSESVASSNTYSETELNNIHTDVDDGLLMKDQFSITASLPNITVSQHCKDPIQEICHKIKSSHTVTRSTDGSELRKSITESETNSPDEEIQCLMDKISVLNKKACDETVEESSISHMMIYPRANTPLLESGDQLPTIVISDSVTLLPISRRGSLISVKSLKTDNDQDTGTLQPLSRCGSFVSIKSIKTDNDQETGTFQPLSRNGSFVSVRSIKTDNDNESYVLKSMPRNGSFVSVKSFKTDNNHANEVQKTLSPCSSFSSIVSINMDNDYVSASDSVSQSVPIKAMDISQINEYKTLVVGSKLLKSSPPPKSNKALKQKNANVHQHVSGKKDKIKTISQFSTLSKSSLSLNKIETVANDNDICEHRSIKYSSALSYSNIAINHAGKDQTKKKSLGENENGFKVENAESKEKIIPGMAGQDKKPSRCKKILRNLFHTNFFCLDLNVFNCPNKSSPSASIRYLPVNNEDTKDSGSKTCQTTDLLSSSQIYLEQYGYPKESLFDGCKCSIM